MSRFVDGVPNKSGYRKFKIKTVSGRDDFAMIGEIIKRRYFRLLEEDSQLPDLIVIDGGKGQLKRCSQIITIAWTKNTAVFRWQKKMKKFLFQIKKILF